MLGLTTLGAIHTVIGLIALLAGAIAIARGRVISFASVAGKVYVITTVIVCLTALPIMEHGGPGPGHLLALVTLAVLALAVVAERSTVFGKWSRYVAALAYSATLLFHLIPAAGEALTRLPPDRPIATGLLDPPVVATLVFLVVAFLIGVTLQARWLRGRH